MEIRPLEVLIASGPGDLGPLRFDAGLRVGVGVDFESGLEVDLGFEAGLGVHVRLDDQIETNGAGAGDEVPPLRGAGALFCIWQGGAKIEALFWICLTTLLRFCPSAFRRAL